MQTPVYYSTAQVTDMVELSDQNVRKYFRMLEERGYEVTRDEYQRRLFSQNDVLILQEMIKISKEPGYTLELAADEVLKQADDIIEKNKEEKNDVASNEEVLKALRLVVDKLEEMRQENVELHQNIKTLVSRLDRYDENLLDTKEQQKLLVSEVSSIKEDLQHSAEKVESDNKELEEIEASIPKEETTEEPSDVEETEEVKDESEETKEEIQAEPKTESEDNRDSYDMNDYQPKETDKEEDEESSQVTFTPEKKKKGFLARLFGG